MKTPHRVLEEDEYVFLYCHHAEHSVHSFRVSAGPSFLVGCWLFQKLN